MADDYILQVKDLKKYFPIKGGMLSRVVGQVKAVRQAVARRPQGV